MALEWHPVSESLPPFKKLFDGWERTQDLLITDCKEFWVGYAQKINNDDGEPPEVRWYLKGRDGYRFDAITHWKYPPCLPTPVYKPT